MANLLLETVIDGGAIGGKSDRPVGLPPGINTPIFHDEGGTRVEFQSHSGLDEKIRSFVNHGILFQDIRAMDQDQERISPQ